MSLTGAYDEANVFAKIMRGDIPCAKVFEDDVALAIMDAFPQSRGHTLVIPKGVQARTLLDLTPAVVGPYFERVQKTARAVAKALAPDGVRIMQFNGAPAGQTVFHLHVHVLPIYEGQGERSHGHAPMGDRAELQALAAQIAAAL